MIRVLVSGCFDLLHIGHLRFLEFAKQQGDQLLVSVASDETYIGYKKRVSIIPEDQRAIIVRALRCVDYVTICRSKQHDWTDYQEFALAALRPGDILVVPSDDKRLKEKQEWCDKYGFQLITRTIDPKEPHTTEIIERIKHES